MEFPPQLFTAPGDGSLLLSHFIASADIMIDVGSGECIGIFFLKFIKQIEKDRRIWTTRISGDQMTGPFGKV
jgi:hypothetical protein